MKIALGVVEIVLIVAFVCVIAIGGFSMFNNLKLNLVKMTKITTTGVNATATSITLAQVGGDSHFSADSSDSDTLQTSDNSHITSNTPITLNPTTNSIVNPQVTAPVSNKQDTAAETTGTLAYNSSSSTSTGTGEAVETVGSTAEEDTSNSVINQIINFGNAIAGAFNQGLNSIFKAFGG